MVSFYKTQWYRGRSFRDGVEHESSSDISINQLMVTTHNDNIMMPALSYIATMARGWTPSAKHQGRSSTVPKPLRRLATAIT
jgi:hypothetical protein